MLGKLRSALQASCSQAIARPLSARSRMHASDPVAGELLGPRLTKGEARPLETQAKRRYRAAGRNLARFAADLRRLQDGEAHLTRAVSYTHLTLPTTPYV